MKTTGVGPVERVDAVIWVISSVVAVAAVRHFPVMSVDRKARIREYKEAMRLSSHVLLTYAVVASGLSCSRSSRLLPDLPCFDAEKLRAQPLVFGAISRDPTSPGGWSGMEVHFGV